jgi:hypothetical protein
VCVARADAPASTLTAEQLRRELDVCQERIRSFRVVYEAGGYDESFPRGTYLHRVVMGKAPNRYYFLTAHGYEGLRWQDDPLHTVTYVLADRWFLVNPLSRWYYVKECRPDEPLPGSMQAQLLESATGLFPMYLRHGPDAEGYPVAMRDVARSEKHSLVRGKQELCDGQWCHVLEKPGADVLWIDVARGCAVLAREFYHESSGACICRYETGGHKEDQPGIWMPRWIRNVQFDFAARTEEARHRKIIDGVISLIEVSINDVDDGVFEFRPPPGAVLLKPGDQPIQTHQGGLDHLDHIVEWVQHHSSSMSPRTDSATGYLAALPAVLIILVCEVYRRTKR